MTDMEQKRIFAKNLNNYLYIHGKTQKEVADAISVSPQTFNTWCQGIALPRMGKVQKLADYFNISKSDLIDEKGTNFAPSFPSCETEDEATLITTYRKLTDIGKKKVSNYTTGMLSLESAELEVAAAHDRTDTAVTQEMIDADNAIMDDEDF